MKYVSFDMDGTLIASEFTDWVWGHGIPSLYARKMGLPFNEAKASVQQEYQRVGEGAIEWYDIKYWFGFFELGSDWKTLLEQYVDKISVFSDANPLLDQLKNRFKLVLTSNAGREFIEVELGATGLGRYFDRIFSATSDFGEVKKTLTCYRRICDRLGVQPSEIVHVGDHYEFDYLVPRALGIRSFYLDRSAQQSGDSVICGLAELEGRLSTAG